MFRMDQAACRNVDSATFFDAAPGDEEAERSAKRICARCPVRLECLTLALSDSRLSGIWGGLTARERAPYTNATKLSVLPTR